MKNKADIKPFYNVNIPSDWGIKTVGELFYERNSLAKNTEEFPLYSLTIENGVTPKTERYERGFLLKDKDMNEFKLVEEGDIVFNPMNLRFGAIAKSKIKSSVTVSAYYNVIRERNETVISDYYVRLFSSDLYKYLFDTVAIGSLVEKKRVHWSILENLFVPFPDFAERQKIATVIELWDTEIKKNNDLIVQKELHKKWLMQILLTGKRRLKGFEKGKWEKLHLGHFFTERTESNQKKLTLLSIGQNGVYPQSESAKKDTSNDDKSKYKRICPGDIGYNTMRMWQGRSALSQLEGIVSPAYTILTPKANADSVFFSYLFKTPKITNLFWRNSQGLVDDTLNCKFKDFAIVKAFLPLNKEEQMAIARILQTADKEIQLLKAKDEKLRIQSKGMAQILLTGKKRLTIKN